MPEFFRYVHLVRWKPWLRCSIMIKVSEVAFHVKDRANY